MSGAGAACSAAKPRAPVPAFAVTMNWTGPFPVDVTSASGSTSGSNRFVHTESGGVPPYQNEALNITSNTSGKLGLTTVGVGVGVSWAGLAVGEAVSITVQFHAEDSAGHSAGPSDTAIIRRIS